MKPAVIRARSWAIGAESAQAIPTVEMRELMREFPLKREVALQYYISSTSILENCQIFP